MNKKFKKYIIFTLIACFATIALSLPCYLGTMNITTIKSTPKTSAAHSIIDISGNTELDAFCAGNGTDGLSWATAHVIEDYEIDGMGGAFCIQISTTTRFLIIRNCEVYNLTFDDMRWTAGIDIDFCQNVRITQCYAYNCGEAGIYARRSTNINISDNRVTATPGGIGLVSGVDCFVSKNEITATTTIPAYDKSGWGIHLSLPLSSSNPSTNNIIIGNQISNCAGDGIWLYKADNNNITDNNLLNNARYGISMSLLSDNNEVHSNYFCNNALGAILNEGTGNNISGSTECPAGIPGYSLMWIIGIILIGTILMSVKIIRSKKTRD